MIIDASNVLFIKLGSQGIWEKECIENGYIKLSFKEADFNNCLKGNWKKIEKMYLGLGKSKIASTGYITQIKYFFDEPETTIWITFYNNKLWWSKASKEITLNPDGTKTRKCINGWSDKDVNGVVLHSENLIGGLLKTQGFRGTICTVEESDYLLRKLNSIKSSEVISTEKSYLELKNGIVKLVKQLSWKDFELLVDLVFTKAGWQRVSTLGKTTKTLDLDLKAPVTGERCLVQIKSSSDAKEFKDYHDVFCEMDQYHKFFYVCHSFKGGKNINFPIKSNIRIIAEEEIAELLIDAGLYKWIIDRVS